MFSLQTILGGKDKVFDLLQASSDTVLESADAAYQLTRDGQESTLMATFAGSRRREKELHAEISEEMINTFVTVLDREDIEAMNTSLYKIPKTLEKFAERYVLVLDRLGGVDFSPRTEILKRCAETMDRMIKELRNGLRIDPLRSLQHQLQALEGEADDLLLEPYRDLYVDTDDPMRAVLAKDLFEILEEVIDLCRDVGNTIYSVVLKNS